LKDEGEKKRGKIAIYLLLESELEKSEGKNDDEPWLFFFS
jgi:hypothetical protein